MKRCPTCKRTFLDEQLGYCTDDGTPLVDQQQASSFDPHATVLNPAPPSTNEISNPGPTRPFRPDDMPGGVPKPYSWADPQSSPGAVTPAPWNPPAPPPSAWNAPTPPGSAWTPPPPPGGRYSASKSQYNPVAIGSLAVGVFSLTIGLCCYLGAGTGPIAIILGVIALVQLKTSPSNSASKGMAIAGIATGAVAFMLIMLFLILGIAFGTFR